MKRAASLAAALLIAATPALAQPTTTDDLCSRVGEMGRLIMAYRQNAEPKLSLYARLPAHMTDGWFGEIFESMVELAYAQPVLDSRAEQIEAVRAFRDRAELLCYRGRRGCSTPIC